MALEDRIREALRGRADEVTEPLDARVRIEIALGRRRRRRPIVRALIACFALALAATSLSVLRMAFEGATDTRRSQVVVSAPPAVPSSAAQSTVVRLDGYVGAVTAGGGALWVSAGNQLFRLDPSSNSLEPILAEVSSTQTFAAGSLWIGAVGGKGEVVKRIDAATNQVVASIPFEADHILEGITGDDTAIWVLEAENRPGGSVAIAKIDPLTNSVVDSIAVDHLIPSSPNEVWVPWGFADGEGAVWILEGGVVNGIGRNGVILRVNPTTDRVSDTLRIGYANDFVVGAGAIWTEVRGEGPVRIDAETLKVQPLNVGSFEPFAIGEGGVWFLDRKGGGVDVARLNTETMQVDISASVEGFPSTVGLEPALDTESHSIWVPDDDNNRLYRVDLT